MDFFLFIKGYQSVILKADDYKRCFNICAFRGIPLYDIQLNEDSEDSIICECKILTKDYPVFLEILEKSNVVLINNHMDGFPRYLHKFTLHISFVIGAIIALFLLFIYSNRIWDIKIEGNIYYGDETIIRYLKNQNIYNGITKNNIFCIQLADDLRGAFENIIWTSAEIDGSKLVIYIKENYVPSTEHDKQNHNNRYDLVSNKNGLVYNILVRRGTANVSLGQLVKKGDLLIEGYVTRKNDNSEIIAIDECIADGEVYILSKYYYYQQIPRIHEEIAVIDDDIKYSLFIDKYRIDNTLPVNNNYIRISENLKSPLSKILILPIGIVKNRIINYKKNSLCYSNDELKYMAEQELHKFCMNLEKKGVQIYENNVKIDISDVSCVMSGEVAVIESIGVLKEIDSNNDYSKMLEE